MFRSGLLWKLYAGFAVLILVSAVFVYLLVAQRIEKDSMYETGESLRSETVFLENLAFQPLLQGDSDSLQERVRKIGSETGVRLTIIRQDGKVIADSEEDIPKVDDILNRPEIIAARTSGKGKSIRFSATLNQKMMHYALPVKDGGKILGYARTSIPLTSVDERLEYLRNIVLMGAAASAFVALVLGFFLVRHLILPITDMAVVVGSMAGGNYSRRIPVSRRDEIGALAMAFNRLAESSQERVETTATDRNRLQAILAGIVEGVIAVDDRERVVHMNDAAGRILGVSPEESRNKPVWETVRIKDFCETITRTMRAKRVEKAELRFQASPNERVVEMNASPLTGEDRMVSGAVAVLHDVSELKKLERVRRDFIANVSHELKTPITAVRGLIETVIDDKEMNGNQREQFLEKIKNQSERLSSIVTDLLTLSRIESQAGALEVDLIDLCGVVSTSVNSLLSTAEAGKKSIISELSDKPVKVMGDREALGEVVSNLLVNALKYSPENGEVRIILTCNDRHAVLEVRDNGIGIEPRHLDRIFERFYRVDKARSREVGGTGLGLAIVRHIAIAHGGKVDVESAPGKGSVFRVTLPLAVA